jgi:hypothetical protein
VPVTWWISHDDRLVLASAEGDISPGSFEEYMSALVAAGAMPYRKLFDVTYATPGAIRLAPLKEFASKVVAFAKQGAVGPLAIFVGSELEQEMAELFARADAGRALAIFSDRTKAREWLDGLAVDKWRGERRHRGAIRALMLSR